MAFTKGHKINKGRVFSEDRNKKISLSKIGKERLDIRLNLSGKKFGRLDVIRFSKMTKGGSIWVCKCDCGKIVEINGSSMVDGNTSSCGCYGLEQRIKARKKHGMRDDPFYINWCAMRYRCTNKKNKGYKNWGGRGIKVCDRWENNFNNFKIDMYASYLKHIEKFGRKNTCLDRVDNNKGYIKNNCRWATRQEQNSNTRRNVFIEFNGEKLTMSEWARKLKVDRTTIYYRVFIAKWSLDKALK